MRLRSIIGDNIRCCRHKLKWSLGKLGSETGLNHDFIGRLERGLENVGVDNLVKIAGVLNVDVAHLLMENYYYSEEPE